MFPVAVDAVAAAVASVAADIGVVAGSGGGCGGGDYGSSDNGIADLWVSAKAIACSDLNHPRSPVMLRSSTSSFMAFTSPTASPLMLASYITGTIDTTMRQQVP